jgi:glycosyltransferase involved in cell wall biosynthesis
MLRSMTGADLVIFVSKYARKRIERIADIRLKAVAVIPHGVHRRFRAKAEMKAVRPDWLGEDGYFLYVSTLDVYKAQIEVVRGFAKWRSQHGRTFRLILAGPENPKYGARVRDEIERLGLRDDVLIVGSVAYEELPVLYQHATVNIFASECENCPNILLEALAACRPVLASNRPPMPEFGGNAVMYFDPTSPDDLAEKLTLIVDGPGCTAELSRRARERSLKYDAGRAAAETWDVIARLHQEARESIE